MSIKAIPTRYKGYHFRSRTEARWAVFFESMGLSWEYEPQGFDTPDGPYLPDFKLHGEFGPVWFEVKGERPTDVEIRKLGHVVRGHPWVGLESTWNVGLIASGFGDSLHLTEVNNAGERSDGYPIMVDTGCGGGPRFNTALWESCLWQVGLMCSDDRRCAGSRIEKAIGAFKRARFEHGEVPT